MFSIDDLYFFYTLLPTNNLFTFYFLAIFIFVVASIFSPFLGTSGVFLSCAIAVSSLWLSALSYFSFFLFEANNLYYTAPFQGTFFLGMSFDFSLLITPVSYSFLLLTTSIGTFALFYTVPYFGGEPLLDRFLLLLTSFILSMSLLVIADNAVLLFLGWELIGLTSFLLINFWSIKRAALKASLKAFFFNKYSDVCLLLFLISSSALTGTLSTSSWNYIFFSLGGEYSGCLFLITLFLLGASSVKSAQIVGHLWLPDSMEAPIPASALIHSATLVSAGIYLLLKFNFLIWVTGLSSLVFALGAVTSFYGAVVASAQTDMKRLLAYSTISHCGFLFISTSLFLPNLTILYLYLHGFFKAFTFFVVGDLTKFAGGKQDIRFFGRLYGFMPTECNLLLVGMYNLAALPFTLGYFYKQYFQVFFLYSFSFKFFSFFILLAMLCSVLYTYRLTFFVIFDLQKGSHAMVVFFKGLVGGSKKGSLSYFCNLVLSLGFLSFFFIFFLYFNFSYFSKISLSFTNEFNLIPITLPFVAPALPLNVIMIFYSLFFSFVLVLSLATYRFTFSFYQLLNFCLFSLCFLFLLSLFLLF